MKPTTRNVISWVIALAPVSLLLNSINISKFLTGAVANLIQQKSVSPVPAPTEFLLAHSGLLTVIPLVVIVAFVLALWLIKRRFRAEADGMLYELMAHTVAWYVAITYLSGVCMAAVLPVVMAANR